MKFLAFGTIWDLKSQAKIELVAQGLNYTL